MKQPSYTVEQIHNDFDLTSKVLFDTSISFLKEAMDGNKSSDLHKEVGFVNSPIVKKQNEIDREQQECRAINHFNIFYPDIKYITEAELNRLCKKYNLIYAPIGNYVKDVPVENLTEIKNSQSLVPDDTAEDKVYCKLYYDNSSNSCYSKSEEVKMKLTMRLCKKLNIPNIVYDQDFVDNVKVLSGHELQLFVFSFLKENYSIQDKYKFISSGVKNITEKRDGLFIAAPLHHFDVKNIDNISEFGYAKVQVHFAAIVAPTYVEDPIVFRYCKSGVQVLSKWGIEKNDELLFNSNHN